MGISAGIMDERFHFVCHECAEEGVYEDRGTALAARDEHVARTDHRVSTRDIADPTA